MIKFLKEFFDKRRRTKAHCEKMKQKHLEACRHITENMKGIIKKNKEKIHEELEELKKKTKILCEDKVHKAHMYSETIVHEALVNAQNTMTTAAKMGDVMTIEMYEKDIYGRPFFRIAPLLDPEGYEALKEGTGGMKFKLIYPDGSRQIVKVVPYNG